MVNGSGPWNWLSVPTGASPSSLLKPNLHLKFDVAAAAYTFQVAPRQLRHPDSCLQSLGPFPLSLPPVPLPPPHLLRPYFLLQLSNLSLPLSLPPFTPPISPRGLSLTPLSSYSPAPMTHKPSFCLHSGVPSFPPSHSLLPPNLPTACLHVSEVLYMSARKEEPQD